MKRHAVMDMLYRDRTEVLDGPWNSEDIPEVDSCKVKVRIEDGKEMFAYFYRDMGIISPGQTEAGYFWCCVDRKPIWGVTHWIGLKDGAGEEKK